MMSLLHFSGSKISSSGRVYTKNFRYGKFFVRCVVCVRACVCVCNLLRVFTTKINYKCFTFLNNMQNIFNGYIF